MAEKLTPQQQTAIENRGGKLLVSAAAGSGKTKVLVDRILRYITDPMDPANIDDFLIITYTQAAAAELRGKIAAKLTQAIAENPESRHIQQQLQRLYLAKISTVHAFCGEILREYAYAVDLPADFRVAEESECEELKERAMEEILDTAYATIGENADFRAFVDSQGFGRNDKAVPEIILSVYDSARCHTDPQKFLEQCIAFADIDDIPDASQTIWGKYLTEELFTYLDMQIEAMSACARQAASVDGWEKPAALLSDTVVQLQHLRQSRTWDEIVSRRSIDYGRLIFPKKFSNPDIEMRIKAVRENCKNKLGDKLKVFCVSGEQVLADIGQTTPAIRGLISLVQAFSKAYAQKKRSRRVVDFGDLEHLMLDLMLGKHRTGPTAASAEVGQRFREIMVDEYQDSNGIQDAIFGALAQKRQNLFFVGDVKQSIYQFRLADPGIFLEKYAAYVPAEQAQPQQGRKVHLSSNFRSGGGVIEAVNHVFRTAMSRSVGDLDYGDDEALREGIPHVPLGEAEVELYGLRIDSDTYAEEAAFVAERVCQLLDGTHKIRDGEGLRPIRPEDIAILLRSPGSVGGYYQAALEQCGIRCANDKGINLLDTEEVGTLRAFLQVISNPRQDIPLLALLMSPVFCFSADEIGRIRAGKTKMSLFESLCAATDDRSQGFLQTLRKLREEARMCTLAELIQKIFLATSLDTVYASMADGDARRENLQGFYQICCGYESSGRKNLEQFLAYLSAAEQKGLGNAGDKTAAGCVTIMSIHKSKGLEFPVVFLGGLSRGFNRDDLRDPVLCHRELGLGLSCVDAEKRIRYPSVAKRAIAARKLRESLSEEMRILYVAMTRARDRLIMVYSAKDLEKTISDLTGRMGTGRRELITSQASCPGTWVLMAALGRTEAGALFALGGKPEQTAALQPAWQIRVAEAPELHGEIGTRSEQKQELPADVCERIRRGLNFQYGHIPATTAPSKQTATQRKGRQKDQEAAESSGQTESNHSFRRAAFREKTSQAKEYGNAIHAAMQYIRYEVCQDTESVQQEINRLVEQRYITAEQGELVNCDQIAAFFQTELGTKLRSGENVLREFKFSILDDAEQYGEGLEGEKVLLQGVVDCALLEENGITVIDFKTDRVSDATVNAAAERYRVQVQTYVDALSRIYGKPVKEAWLYFFCLNRFIRL